MERLKQLSIPLLLCAFCFHERMNEGAKKEGVSLFCEEGEGERGWRGVCLLQRLQREGPGGGVGEERGDAC